MCGLVVKKMTAIPDRSLFGRGSRKSNYSLGPHKIKEAAGSLKHQPWKREMKVVSYEKRQGSCKKKVQSAKINRVFSEELGFCCTIFLHKSKVGCVSALCFFYIDNGLVLIRY